MSYYPREIYNINETITQENIRIYDQRQKAINAKCLELDPNYYKLNLKERYKLRQRVKEKYNL